MDKLTTISATLFMAADVFAIVSLAMPDWIVTEEAGKFVFYKTFINFELNCMFFINIFRGYTFGSYVDLYDFV